MFAYSALYIEKHLCTERMNVPLTRSEEKKEREKRVVLFKRDVFSSERDLRGWRVKCVLCVFVCLSAHPLENISHWMRFINFVLHTVYFLSSIWYKVTDEICCSRCSLSAWVNTSPSWNATIIIIRIILLSFFPPPLIFFRNIYSYRNIIAKCLIQEIIICLCVCLSIMIRDITAIISPLLSYYF